MSPDTDTAAPVPRPALVAFLIMLNITGIFGQTFWFQSEISKSGAFGSFPNLVWGVSIVTSLIIESISVYLSAMAHAATMSGQSSWMLRTSAVTVAAFMGWTAYMQFTRYDMPSIGKIYGIISASSPWMWSIYTKHISRGERISLGLVDPPGPKLSTNRIMWHPLRSVRVLSHAAWRGISSPLEAVRSWETEGTHPRNTIPASGPELSTRPGTSNRRAITTTPTNPELPPGNSPGQRRELPTSAETSPRRTTPTIPELSGGTSNTGNIVPIGKRPYISTAERRKQIGNILAEHSGATATEIAEILGITPRRVRGIIAEMEETERTAS